MIGVETTREQVPHYGPDTSPDQITAAGLGTIETVALEVGVSTVTVRRWIRAGLLPVAATLASHSGLGGRAWHLYRLDDVHEAAQAWRSRYGRTGRPPKHSTEPETEPENGARDA